MAKGKYQEWLEPNNLILLKGWARDGLTDAKIADKIGINVATLYRWKNDHCKICEALSIGKEVADYEAENALYKRVTGYDYWEVTEIYDDESGEWIPKDRKLKHVPGDVTAQSMWLRNRQKEKWKANPVPDQDSEVLQKAVALLGGIQSAID